MAHNTSEATQSSFQHTAGLYQGCIHRCIDDSTTQSAHTQVFTNLITGLYNAIPNNLRRCATYGK